MECKSATYPSFCHIHTKMSSSPPSTSTSTSTTAEFKRLYRNLKRREYYYRGTNNAEKLEEVRKEIHELSKAVDAYETYEAVHKSEAERSEIIDKISSAEPTMQSDAKSETSQSEEEAIKPLKPKSKRLVKREVIPPRWSNKDIVQHLLLALVFVLMFYFAEPVEPTV